MSVPETTIFEHYRTDVRKYSAAWADRLATGETVSAYGWTVSSGTAGIANSAAGSPGSSATGTLSGTTTTIWVNSATAGRVVLLATITTSLSRVLTRPLVLEVW